MYASLGLSDLNTTHGWFRNCYPTVDKLHIRKSQDHVYGVWRYYELCTAKGKSHIVLRGAAMIGAISINNQNIE